MYFFILEVLNIEFSNPNESNETSIWFGVNTWKREAFILITLGYSIFCFVFGASFVRSFDQIWRYTWMLIYFLFPFASIFAPRTKFHYIFKLMHTYGAVATFCGMLPIVAWKELLHSNLSNSWIDLYHHIFGVGIILIMVLESAWFILVIDEMTGKQQKYGKKHLLILMNDYLPIESLTGLHVLYFGCLSSMLNDSVQSGIILTAAINFHLPSVAMLVFKCFMCLLMFSRLVDGTGLNTTDTSVHILTMSVLVSSMICFQTSSLFLLGTVAAIWSLYTVKGDMYKEKSVLEGSGIAAGILFGGIIVEYIICFVLSYF
jgi:hypothetical protein